MDKSNQAYETPTSNVQVNEESQPTAWKVLAAWTAALIVVNTCLSYVSAVSRDPPVPPETLFGYVIGNALGIPIIVLLISQIWRRFRNGRSRVKAILYPSILVLLTKGLVLVAIVYVIIN